MFKQVFRRFLPAALISEQEREIRQAVRELQQYSDYELNDLGIPRSQIEHCVRYGRPDTATRVAPTGPGNSAAKARLQVVPATRDTDEEQDLAA